jgi:bifunctional non-homologous end joining protein LigD
MKRDPRLLTQAKKSLMPELLAPELSFLVNTTPTGDNWLHEVKYDGYRLLCFIHEKEIRFITRNAKDWTDKFLFLVPHLKKLKLKNAILDGEVVALEKDKVSFQALQSALKGVTQPTILYFIFDIPYCNDYNLTQVPLIERKEYLKSLFKNIPTGSNIVCSEFIRGNGEYVFQEACKASLEGIMSKRYDSPYESERSHAWVKSKCAKRQEFVIGGYTQPKNSREAFGALLLGYYDKSHHLVYCGKVGTGFNTQHLNEYLSLFAKHLSKQSPFFDNTLIPNKKEIVWLKPKFIGEVQFTEFTEDHLLRHPSFLGLRIKDDPINTLISLTHPEKILYPKTKTTKLDLIHYYEQIQDWILPYVINRPLSVLRCPEGYGKTCFFQKHPHKHFSEHVYAIDIKTDKEHYIYIKNIKGLLSLVQANVLEIHPWGSKIDNLEKPDQITFDLDPGPEVSWKTIVKSAYWIRDALHDINLDSFIKTSGRKGLHVVVPIARRLEWPDLKEFAKYFSAYVSHLYPETFIANMNKSKRENKIYVDYLRNDRGATSVCAYSTRVGERPTVSTPLTWAELKLSVSADYYNINNIIKRLDHISDPWEDFLKTSQVINNSLISKIKKEMN